VSISPADLPFGPDPLDPERILRALPEQERAEFLSAYQLELEAARDPAHWRGSGS
jgi:hypothetical protein